MESNTLKNLSTSDEEIIDRIIAGETCLYESLVRKFNTRLYRICMSILNDEAEAEDVMQITYINAYLHLSGFQKKSSFSTWLTRILINESLQHKKKKLKDIQVLQAQIPKDPPDDGPLNSMMNKELKILLREAVASLPEKYRLVFVMREVQELSTLETMEILNIGESNVKIRLNRAKEMLRHELKAYHQLNELYDFHLLRCDRIFNLVDSALNISKTGSN